AGDDAASTDGIVRETFAPRSLAAELRRYADSVEIPPTKPFVDVSPRRVQMLVSEAADRAAERTGDSSLASITPRDLRQAFARRLLDRGVDSHVVREAGGWETMDALEPYLDSLSGEAIAKAVTDVSENETRRSDREHDHPATSDDALVTIHDAFAAIPSTTDRTELFEAVVERLSAGTHWRGVWIVRGVGGDQPAGSGVVAVADASDDGCVSTSHTDGPLDALPTVADGSTPPWTRAMTEREPVVGVVDGEGNETAVNTATDGSGTSSLLAVPIAHRETTYGALCLWRANEETTAIVEQEALATLGRCLGWAVTAGRWRDLLHSDAVTEVEFHTTDPAAFLARASDTLDCRIELDSTVSISESASRCFLRVAEADPQAVATVVEAADGVSTLRVVETRADGCTVSVRASSGTLVRALTERGATVRDAVARDGRVRVVADLPDGTDIRPIADGLRATYPDVRLVSKESVARSHHTESTLRDGVTERLTDRQWATLSAAYHSGYFDWPRGSTAEEIADTMEVSSPTFHNHLRKAQRALLDTLFDDEKRDSG
ncbi:MAG: bacterio-opsin activator domain-containing protein, partial [Halorubrum sp.]